MFSAGNILRKKHRRMRTDEGDDDQDNTEHVRNKKWKNSFETEVDSSSSDHSCFVALVTASNLHNDTLYLPQDLTSSVGRQRNCSEIVVTDEKERSWPLDLRFNKSSETFYITRGWRSFCDENGKKAGGVFVFKLVGNWETPVLSFCSTESINDGTQGDKNNKENCMQLERKQKRMRCRVSTLPSQNRFVTLTLTHNSLKKCRQYLPSSFLRKNGLDKPGMITLLGKAGMKWLASLKREANGSMVLGKGWNDFVKANGLTSGKSFTLEVISEKGTPMLSLFSTQSTSERSQQRASMNRFVTLTLTHTNLIKSRQYLPLSFTKANGLDKPGLITLVGEDGAKWEANLLRGKTGIMCLGKGWKHFSRANSIKCGESFTLKAILENGTPMLSLCSTQSTSDRSQQGECSKGSEKESILAGHSSGKETRKAKDKIEGRRDSLPASMNRFVTLTLRHDNLITGRRYLPFSFTRENGLDKPGKINLIGKDGTKWEANIGRGKTGVMCIGKGWKNFAIANGLKSGESFTLEVILENGTPMLSLFSTEATSGRSQQGERCKDSEKGSISAEPTRGNKATSNREERTDSSSAIRNRFVTLTLTPEDVRDCKLIIPSQFMKANGINKLGRITILGQHRMKCFAYLLSKDGFVALGSGWKGFCEANGVKIGDSFTLECICEQDTTHVFKFSSNSVE
ncbi:PREDICTED: B3 domain-containing protein REM12-like isoform X1 [Camelina sativa]|nr:PREDICTED: B3 domain-containing protein REM12-like isoform X1 [Camelina sativa]